ncbi:MAG: uroporphyrinogen decarboxylase/cobalamine-independent methonine synthase family protein [Methanoregula sp.]
MAKMITSPHSQATGVGALPHKDPREACNDVLEIFPSFPYIPTLPDRGQLESIVFNDSEQLPGRIIRDDRLLFDSTTDQTAAMEQVYMDYVEQNFAPYALHKDYASAFSEMMNRDLANTGILKFQVTGPVTFGMQVVDADKRPIYYDSQLADVLAKMLALKARWCEVEMKKQTGVQETLIVLNEPYLASLGSSVVPVDKETVKAGWEDIASLVQGGLGIHCCSNTDWEFVLGLNPSVVSIDAYTTAKEFLLYTDTITGYMERGGVVAWGIVPADSRIFVTETTGSLYQKYLDIRTQLCTRMPEDLFDAQSLITPSCGIRFADRASACSIMQAAAEISKRVCNINS